MSWADAVTFASAWERSVARAPHDPFLLFEGPDGRTTTWSYGEFDAVVGRAAQLLHSHGVGGGDAVHLALTNSPAFVALWLATVRLGAWLVPSDPMGATAELAGHIRRTEPLVG
ncbi:MAG: AMP-binding protein, partial [Ilumatobacteraceae bacterium]